MKAKQMGIEDNLVNDAKFLQLSLDQEISEEILKRIVLFYWNSYRIVF
jgi:hypothetical protein